ncbi:MAG: four helix bundle protein [Prevotellaceae bacterium]|jgi:four helix bundle protein|nr:four helix bundle protein [Prevotellaceae bacterium]
MATVNSFEDLEIWKMARSFCKEIFRITNYDLFSKDFRLKEQMRASSGSIMDNIAEGFERNGNKEFIHFLYIAKGSCGEIRSQLYRALDYSYINANEFEILIGKAKDISKSVNNFITYLKNSQMSGIKYK